jgi:hypothetical protein
LKNLLYAGMLLLVLGIASLVIPIRSTETQGIKAGDVSFGVQTTHSERVSPIISIVLICGGVLMAVAGVRAKT